MKKQKGFTLVELLVVIAILGILATVSIFGYNSYKEKANQVAYKTKVSQNVEALRTDLENDLENHTYFILSESGKEVAWYEYVDFGITQLDASPELGQEYGYPMNKNNSSMESGVVAYRPIMDDLVIKVNELLSSSSTDNFLELADAGLKLNDEEFKILNYYEGFYRVCYSKTSNKIYITNETKTEIRYSNTGLSSVPADNRVLRGMNIRTSDDLEKLSEISNLHLNGIPTVQNIFVKETPVVICNLKSDVVLDDPMAFSPIANWYIWGGNYGSIYYDICLLFNGNNHKISGFAKDGFIGALRPGSVLRDFETVFAIGTSTQKHIYSVSGYTNSLYNNYGWWHSGLLTNFIDTRQSSEKTYIQNIKMSGKIYLDCYNTGSLNANTLGIITSFFHNQNNSNIVIYMSNLDLFTGSDDTVELKLGSDGFGVLTGMGDYWTGSTITSELKQISYSNIEYNEIFDTYAFGRQNGAGTTNPLFGNREGW